MLQALVDAKQLLLTAAKAQFVGERLAALATPFLVLDMRTVSQNMEAMKTFCATHRVALRPHAKMHKSLALGSMQVKCGGAVGMCVQKVSEAEVLSGIYAERTKTSSDTYVRNLFISNEVIGSAKLRRVAQLAKFLNIECMTQKGYLAVAVDSVAGVHELAAALRQFEVESSSEVFIYVLIEVNIGQNRGGCPVTEENLGAVCKAVKEHPKQLKFEGLHAYHGGAQHIREISERRMVMQAAIGKVTKAISICKLHFVAVPVVTGAGTGTFFLEGLSGVYTEVQPGSYLVLDRDYGENAVRGGDEGEPVDGASPEGIVPTFNHALFLQTTVVSKWAAANKEEPNRIVLDGGHKSGAIDCGGPAIAPFQLRRLLKRFLLDAEGQQASGGSPSARVHRIAELGSLVVDHCYVVCGNGGDDHSLLRSPLTLLPKSGGSTALRPQAVLQEASNAIEEVLMATLNIGDTVFLVPGHCDPTFNLHDIVLCSSGIDTDEGRAVVSDVIAVDARGCQQ